MEQVRIREGVAPVTQDLSARQLSNIDTRIDEIGGHDLSVIEARGVRSFTTSEYLILGALGIGAFVGVLGFILTAVSVQQLGSLVIMGGCFSGIISPIYAGWRVHSDRLRDAQLIINKELATQVGCFRNENIKLRAIIVELEEEISILNVQVTKLEVVQRSLVETAIRLGGTVVKKREILATLEKVCNEEMQSILGAMEGLRKEQKELMYHLERFQEKEKEMLEREVELHEQNEVLSIEMRALVERMQQGILEKRYQQGGSSTWREFVFLLYERIVREGLDKIDLSQFRVLAERANEIAFSRWVICEVQELIGTLKEDDFNGAYYEFVRDSLIQLGGVNFISYEDCLSFKHEVIDKSIEFRAPKDVKLRSKLETLFNSLKKPIIEEIFPFLK